MAVAFRQEFEAVRGELVGARAKLVGPLRAAPTQSEETEILIGEDSDVEQAAHLIARVLVSPDHDIEELRAMVARQIRSLKSGRARTDEMTASVARITEQLRVHDMLLSDEVREQCAIWAAEAREDRAAIEALRIPEDAPLSFALSPWVRAFNDATLRLSRALLDRAESLEARLEQERLEDEEANAWSKNRPPLDLSAETVSLEELEAELARSEG